MRHAGPIDFRRVGVHQKQRTVNIYAIFIMSIKKLFNYVHQYISVSFTEHKNQEKKNTIYLLGVGPLSRRGPLIVQPSLVVWPLPNCLIHLNILRLITSLCVIVCSKHFRLKITRSMKAISKTQLKLPFNGTPRSHKFQWPSNTMTCFFKWQKTMQFSTLMRCTTLKKKINATKLN